MKSLDVLKLVLMLVAIGIWAYGVHSGRRELTIVAIVFLIAAFLLRFLPKITRRP